MGPNTIAVAMIKTVMGTKRRLPMTYAARMTTGRAGLFRNPRAQAETFRISI